MIKPGEESESESDILEAGESVIITIEAFFFFFLLFSLTLLEREMMMRLLIRVDGMVRQESRDLIEECGVSSTDHLDGCGRRRLLGIMYGILAGLFRYVGKDQVESSQAKPSQACAVRSARAFVG
jgi:hypothetical protein